MKKSAFVLIFVTVCLLSACAPDPMISFSQESVVTSNEAYNTTLSVTTTYDWTASTNSKWIKISPSSGPKGTTQIALSIEVNNSFDGRTGEILFLSKDISKTLPVSQDQKNSLLVSNGNFHLPFVADTIDVKLMANVAYTCSIPDGVNWVREITTKGLAESHKLFQIEENTGHIARTAVISFTDKTTGVGSSVTIVQDPHIIFEFASDSVTVAYNEDSFIATIRTNGKFSWNISNCDWLSCNDAPEFKVGELQEYPLRFSLTNAAGHASRDYTIVFVDANKVRHKLYTCQDAAPYIIEVTYATAEAVAPTVKDAEEATIDWGDGTSVEPYTLGMTHTYQDDGPHTVKVISKTASKLKLTNLCGVEKLDFRFF